MEEWRAVVGYEGLYEVSNLGRVRSLGRTVNMPRGGTRYYPPAPISLVPHPRGYLYVNLWISGNRRMAKVHRLVLEAFVGPAPDRHVGCHWDGNPSNNELGNLRWDTQKENCADDLRNGVRPRGEKHWKSKLTADQVLAIRSCGKRQIDICEEYGLASSTVSEIINRKRWSWL